jgi:hypothetical protein
MNNGQTIALGDEAKDTVTGFTGIVMCRTEWINGCVRTSLQSRVLKDDKVTEMQTFDEMQLELVSSGVVPVGGQRLREPIGPHTGGPRPEPTRAVSPR